MLQWAIGEYNSKGVPEVHKWGNGQMFGAVRGTAWNMELNRQPVVVCLNMEVTEWDRISVCMMERNWYQGHHIGTWSLWQNISRGHL